MLVRAIVLVRREMEFSLGGVSELRVRNSPRFLALLALHHLNLSA